MDTKIKAIILISFSLCMLVPLAVNAQLEEGTSDRYIRVAEMGELVDSVNVWGDVTNSGRYLIPEGTNLPELISYSFGYTQRQGGNRQNVDWTKTQIEVKVSRYIKSNERVDVAFFRYRYHDPEPVKMFEYELQNNDIVTVQVGRKPSFTDYVGVIAPVVGVIATSFLLIENLRGNR